MSFSLASTNRLFNITYTLTSQQIQDTIITNPSGFYLLYDLTDIINLGYNTIQQNQYGSININITNGNKLIFNNRFVSSAGNKTINILFNYGPPNYNAFIIDSFSYNAIILPFPSFSVNTVTNSQINLTETNFSFDMIYTLTPQQLQDTIITKPSGFYLLYDLTDSINLGNNTIQQNQFSAINVNITNSNQLIFNNRFVPSAGNKTINILFNYGPPNYNATIIDSFNYNAIILPEPPFTCFKENTKILTNKGYISIEELRKGSLIKTINNNYKPIYEIGKKTIYNENSDKRIANQLYKCTSSNYPEIFEDLIITGHHSILVDLFQEDERKKTINAFGKIYITDNKYRLPVCVDNRAIIYNEKGFFTIYHFSLEDDNDYINYGIYANGLLVESCCKKYLKELSNMTIIE